MTSDALALGLVSTAATLLFLLRLFSLRQIARRAWLIDAAFTVLFAYLLRGTLGGMAGAIMAGLCLSLTLHAIALVYRYTDTAKRRAQIAAGYRLRIKYHGPKPNTRKAREALDRIKTHLRPIVTRQHDAPSVTRDP